MSGHYEIRYPPQQQVGFDLVFNNTGRTGSSTNTASITATRRGER